jgi:hypothetical protein
MEAITGEFIADHAAKRNTTQPAMINRAGRMMLRFFVTPDFEVGLFIKHLCWGYG